MLIQVTLGDITRCRVDAIANAANSGLLGGGGVDGAIHRAAGPQLLAACRHLRSTVLPAGLPPGQAVATPGFDLPTQWVIHTVGPNRHAGQDDPGVLRSCYRSCLELAERIGARSLAFPAIGAGVYGWSARDSANAARSALVEGPTGADGNGRADGAEDPDGVGDPDGAVDPDGTGRDAPDLHALWPGIELVEFVAFSPEARLAFSEILHDLL